MNWSKLQYKKLFLPLQRSSFFLQLAKHLLIYKFLHMLPSQTLRKPTKPFPLLSDKRKVEKLPQRFQRLTTAIVFTDKVGAEFR